MLSSKTFLGFLVRRIIPLFANARVMFVQDIENANGVEFAVVSDGNGKYTLQFRGHRVGDVLIQYWAALDELELDHVSIDEFFEDTRVRGTRLCVPFVSASLAHFLGAFRAVPANGYTVVESSSPRAAIQCYTRAFAVVGYTLEEVRPESAIGAFYDVNESIADYEETATREPWRGTMSFTAASTVVARLRRLTRSDVSPLLRRLP